MVELRSIVRVAQMRTAVRRKSFPAEAHLVVVDGEPWYEWTPETVYNFDKALKGWRVRRYASELTSKAAFSGFPGELSKDGVTIRVEAEGTEPVVDGPVEARVIRALKEGTAWGGRPSTEEQRLGEVLDAIRFYAEDRPVADISQRMVAGRCFMVDINGRPTRPFTKLVAKFRDTRDPSASPWLRMKERALR